MLLRIYVNVSDAIQKYPSMCSRPMQQVTRENISHRCLAQLSLPRAITEFHLSFPQARMVSLQRNAVRKKVLINEVALSLASLSTKRIPFPLVNSTQLIRAQNMAAGE